MALSEVDYIKKDIRRCTQILTCVRNPRVRTDIRLEIQALERKLQRAERRQALGRLTETEG